MSNILVSSPGKVILFGEHAVVYGYPAVVTAVHRTLQISMEYDKKKAKSFFHTLFKNVSDYSVVDLMNLINETDNAHSVLHVHSQIPLGCGMGSSAACAASLSALVMGVAQLKFSREKINELAFLIEKRMHGNPSGVDNTIVCFGGLLQFLRKGKKVEMKRIIHAKKFAHLWIVNTGVPTESTAEMVSMVKEKYIHDSKHTELSFQKIGAISESFSKHIQNEKDGEYWYLLIQENEQLLESLGVVSEKTKKFIRTIEKNMGAAKISGAGGVESASGVVLVYHADEEKFHHMMKKSSFEYFPLVQNNTGIEVYET